MHRKDCLQIGSIVKIHGIHGEIVLETANPDLIENIKESALLEIEGLLVPFFIDDWVVTSNERCRIKFLWVDTENAAKRLLGCKVFMPIKEVELREADFTSKPNLMLGFLASDITQGELGIIIDFIDNQSNPLLVIQKGKKELLVPLHTDFIIEVQAQNKKVVFNLPEGLTDLFQ
jgi:16S rRNA processing protein RimM